MKQIIWLFVFMLYLMMAIGFLLLIGNGLNAFDFAKTDTFKFVFGFISMFITLCGGYLTADYIGKSWYSENPDVPDKKKNRSRLLIFTIVFIIMFALFRLHDAFISPLFPDAAKMYLAIKVAFFRINLHSIIQFFVLPFEVNDSNALLSAHGMLFIALTIFLSYIFTGIAHKKKPSEELPEQPLTEGV